MENNMLAVTAWKRWWKWEKSERDSRLATKFDRKRNEFLAWIISAPETSMYLKQHVQKKNQSIFRWPNAHSIVICSIIIKLNDERKKLLPNYPQLTVISIFNLRISNYPRRRSSDARNPKWTANLFMCNSRDIRADTMHPRWKTLLRREWEKSTAK